MSVVVKLGHNYRTRFGGVAGVIKARSSVAFPWAVMNERGEIYSVTNDGRFYGEYSEMPEDLIEDLGPAIPAPTPEPTPTPIQMRVGHRYLSRNGTRFTCTKHRPDVWEDLQYQVLDEDLGYSRSVSPDGRYDPDRHDHDFDIVEDLGPVDDDEPDPTPAPALVEEFKRHCKIEGPAQPTMKFDWLRTPPQQTPPDPQPTPPRIDIEINGTRITGTPQDIAALILQMGETK